MQMNIEWIERYVLEKGISVKAGRIVNQALLKILRIPNENIIGDENQPVLGATTDRIQEILPPEGKVRLSRKDTKVVMSGDDGSFREAYLDLSEAQPVPTGRAVDLSVYRSCPLEAPVYFSRKNNDPDNTSSAFLARAIGVLRNAPAVEISRHTGDTCNRYFSMRKYSK